MIDIILVPLLLAGLVVNGLRLRARVPTALPGTAAAHDPAGVPSAPPRMRPGDGAWIVARGAVLDDATARDTEAYMLAEGLDMVDLVPADLPVTAARDLAREVDPRTYREHRLAVGHSAGAAALVAPALLERAGATVPRDPQPADLIGLARRIRPYAERGASIMAAPRLRQGADDLRRRQARLRASGVIVPLHLALDAMGYLLTIVALAADWEWGLAAAVAYCLQPYLIFAGTALRPRGLHAAALLRLVFEPCVWAWTAAGRWRSAADEQRDAEKAEAAAYYRAALAGGTERLLEPRRGDCPWCGSDRLTVLLRVPDLVMRKPGTFTLERCGGCGHTFQNPRLTPEGLGFYYRDAYDGLGAASAEAIFLTAEDSYRARARMPEPFTSPKAWLDVGTGHAHFCVTAREVWPETVFDGLDQGAEIEEAERRGWIATAHRGMFPELAPELAGRYDVISMHHYLEHTREPLIELDAAAGALPAGGHLLIELPDPQWRLARLFGRYWMPWFQPQHQHLMPVDNLLAALRERGLRPLAVERGPAHQANDAVAAAYLFFAGLAPDRAKPWSPSPPTAASRAWLALVWAAGVPVIVAGLLLDRTLGRALARRWDRGNAYRVLARREDAGNGR
jgi:hypothetical protein